MAKDLKDWGKKSGNGGGSALYFVGFLGALVYFWQVSNGLWEFIIGFIKACLWPAFMVYELFKYLQIS